MPDRPTRTRATDQSTAVPPTGDSTGLAPDPPASPAAVPDPPPGYEFVGEIGHGGMGVVYQARDLSLDRDVAVKLLQDRYPVGSFAARRFLDEARITGQLQHPGIPAVHQVGALPDGRPFLAMKLIKGRTLDELLAERSDPSADRGRFLAVFEQVCQAVGYAHAHHVIHRDLKPANVMVGAFGEVQVMDWGLAKVLTSRGVQPSGDGPDETTLGTEIRSTRGEDAATQAGSLLGTPAYMAPEQAIGAVDRLDERTDVFGLGGVLCAVLTGRPPYVGDTAESTRQLAARAKLDDAHARLDACGAEPELVVLCRRCLSPESSDRPRHAGEVANAVHQLRADAEDRARRAELDRAKAEVQAAEQRKRRKVQAALAAAVLAAGGLAAGGGWWMDRQETVRETERRVEAARNREAAEVALDQAEQALRKDNPIYGEIDAALAQAEKRLADGGPDGLRERLAGLTRARRMLDRLDAIDAQRWSGSSSEQKIDTASARTAYPTAFREYGLDIEADPPSALAEIVRRSPIAARLMAALDDWLDTGGSDALLALTGHLDPDPARAALRRALKLGDAATIAGSVAKLDDRRTPPAFAAFVGGHERTPPADAVRILRAAQAAHPTHFGLAIQTARRLPSTQVEDQIGYYRIAIAIRPTNSVSYNNLGVNLMDTGDTDAAIAAYRQSIRLDPKVAVAHSNLGVALERKGDLDGAVVAHREAVRLGPKIATAHSNLGVVLLRKGDADGAIAACRQSIRLDPKSAIGHDKLGVVLVNKGDLDGAIAAHREAIRLDPKLAAAHGNLGNALSAKGDLDGAAAAHREAIRLDPKNAIAHRNLGITLYDKGDFNGAIAAYREAIRLDPKYTLAHNNLGNALLAKGNLDGAIAEYRGAIRLDPKYAGAHNGLGVALERKGDLDGAITAYTRAVGLKINLARSYLNLASLLGQRGKPRAALDVLQQGARVNPSWLTNPATSFRYNSVCFACLSAAGPAKDVPPPAERPALRKQGLDWLAADLAAWRKHFAADPAKNRAAVHRTMAHWLSDPDLASVRERAELEKLPLDERVGWVKLWTAVRELRDATAPPEAAPPPRPVVQ